MNRSNNLTSSSQWFSYISVTIAVFLIAICILGIILNCISFFVFLQKYFRNISINILLASLSFVDMCLLISSAPVYSSFPLTRIFPKLMPFNLFCIVYLYPLTLIFHCASVWLLIPITFERWIAVCRPMFVSRYCTRKGAILSVLLIFILSIIYNICRFWDFRLHESGMLEFGLRSYRPYVLWYINISQLLFFYIIPLTFIASLNCLIRAQIIRSETTRLQMSSTEQCNTRTARMLFYVVFGFMSCYSLSLVLNLIQIFDPLLLANNVGQILIYLNNMLVVANASITSTIYYRFSTRYRIGVKILLSRIFLPTLHQQLLSMPSINRQLSIFTGSSMQSGRQSIPDSMTISVNSVLPRRRAYTLSFLTSSTQSLRSNSQTNHTNSSRSESVSSEPKETILMNSDCIIRKEKPILLTRSLSGTTANKKKISLRTLTLKKESCLMMKSDSTLVQLDEVIPLDFDKSRQLSDEQL